MKLPSFTTLIVMATGCGMGVGAMWLVYKKEKENYTARGSFVPTAIKIVREQPMITEIIGENFKVGRPSLKDGWGKVDKYQAQVRVPVIGDKEKGDLFAYARKKDKTEKFQLYKLEMTFDNVKGKKLVIMDLDKEANSDTTTEKADAQLDDRPSDSNVKAEETKKPATK